MSIFEQFIENATRSTAYLGSTSHTGIVTKSPPLLTYTDQVIKTIMDSANKERTDANDYYILFILYSDFQLKDQRDESDRMPGMAKYAKKFFWSYQLFRRYAWHYYRYVYTNVEIGDAETNYYWNIKRYVDDEKTFMEFEQNILNRISSYVDAHNSDNNVDKAVRQLAWSAREARAESYTKAAQLFDDMIASGWPENTAKKDTYVFPKGVI